MDQSFRVRKMVDEKPSTSKDTVVPALFRLPSELQLHIFSFLSYDDISRTRAVCRQFDSMCQRLLTAGFHLVERCHSTCMQQIKLRLPRRESERRNHELARHADILSAIETRLNLLSMTYGKYTESGICCFIPGKVLDEIFRVLHFVSRSQVTKCEDAPRPHEILQELRDISSMAMEHFEEHIVPTLRERVNLSAVPSAVAGGAMSTNALVMYATAGIQQSLVSCRPWHTVSSAPPTPLFLRQKSANTTANENFHSRSVPSGNRCCIDHKQLAKLQHQLVSQRAEMCMWKRQFLRIRCKQKFVEKKCAESERRLNDCEQRLGDIFAQLRSSASGNAPTTSVTATGSSKRKKPMLFRDFIDCSESSSSSDDSPPRRKRRKPNLNNELAAVSPST